MTTRRDATRAGVCARATHFSLCFIHWTGRHSTTRRTTAPTPTRARSLADDERDDDDDDDDDGARADVRCADGTRTFGEGWRAAG